jgi:hypothetical protein
MKRDEHEAILTKILAASDPAKQGDMSELLQGLREDYGGVLSHTEEVDKENAALAKTNDDLTQSNSRLFLQLGQEHDQQQQDDDDKKHAETVTLNDILNKKG